MNETSLKELWDKMESLWNQSPPKIKKLPSINTFDDFKSKMSSQENRKLFYDYVGPDLKKNGIDLGTIEEFEKKYGKPSIIQFKSDFECIRGRKGVFLKVYGNYPDKEYLNVNGERWVFTENGDFTYINKKNQEFPGKWMCDGYNNFKIILDNNKGTYNSKDNTWIKESIVKKHLLEFIRNKEKNL